LAYSSSLSQNNTAAAKGRIEVATLNRHNRVTNSGSPISQLADRIVANCRGRRAAGLDTKVNNSV